MRVVPASEELLDPPDNIATSPKDGINATLKDSNATGTLRYGGSGQDTPTVESGDDRMGGIRAFSGNKESNQPLQQQLLSASGKGNKVGQEAGSQRSNSLSQNEDAPQIEFSTERNSRMPDVAQSNKVRQSSGSAKNKRRQGFLARELLHFLDLDQEKVDEFMEA